MYVHWRSLLRFQQHQKDLALLKERLDLLDDNQKQQLQELKGISPIGTPTKGYLSPKQSSPRYGDRHSLASDDDIISSASEFEAEKPLVA